MPHNLKQSRLANGQGLFTHFFYVKEDGVPWHGYGVVEDAPVRAPKALSLIHGTKPVTLVRLQWPDGTEAKSGGLIDADGNKLAEVGSDYTPLQFSTAFEHFDQALGCKALVRTAGLLGQGEGAFVSAKIAKAVVQLKDRMQDVVDHHLVLETWHGRRAEEWRLTTVRPVCENTLRLGESSLNMKASTKVHHRANVELESALVAKAFERYGQLATDATHAFQLLADSEVGTNDDVVYAYAKKLFVWGSDEDPEDEVVNPAPSRIRNKRDELVALYRTAPGQDQPDTAYKLYNAATYLNDKVLRKGRWAQTEFQVAAQQFRDDAFQAALQVAGVIT